MGWHDEEEHTRPDLKQPPLLRPSLQARAVEQFKAGGDDAEMLGMLMRQTIQNTRAIVELRTSITTLSQEVRQHSRGIESDRPILAKDAAKSSSNRLAAIMTGLFTLYEVTSPYVRGVWDTWKAHHG